MAPDRATLEGLTAALPVAGVHGVMTTRKNPFGAAPFDLGHAEGHDAAAVAANRRRFAEVLGASPVYLRQVHGAAVARLTPVDARPGAPVRVADASVTTEPGLACTVLVADCLPVLYAATNGRAVGAAHAGWRGLALGVLEATHVAVAAAAECRPDEVAAWLGACIGPTAFEVGPDVVEAFDAIGGAGTSRFVPGRPGKWFADLAGLAADRLRASGLGPLSGAGVCTVTEASRFFSFRRDGATGRMAAAVWIERR